MVSPDLTQFEISYESLCSDSHLRIHCSFYMMEIKGGLIVMLKKQKRYLYLDDEEISVMLQSLIRLKNTLIREGRYTDCVDELIVKVMEAPTRKIKIT